MNDRRRFLTTKTLHESVDSHKLLEDTFKELDKLYEADETTNNDQEQGEEKDPKLAANISKLSDAAAKTEIPEKNIKLTGRADKIYDLMVDLLKKSKLSDAVQMLELICKDDKLKLLLQHGFSDGSNEDGKLSVEMVETSIPVKDLLPTQSEIGISNSLDNLVKGTFSKGKDDNGKEKTGIVNYADYFATPALKAAGPVFVYQGLEGNYIIDGHHRWSQIYCMNPDAKAYCKVIKTDKKLNDEHILKNFQAAIAADPKKQDLGRKPAGFTNLFGADEAILKTTVQNMSEEVAGKIAAVVPKEKLTTAANEVKFEDGSETQNQARAYLVANAKLVAKVKRPSDRKRILMPQTDGETFDIVKDAMVGI